MLGLGNNLASSSYAGFSNSYSLEFDGTDGYISIADAANLSFGADGTSGNEPAFSLSVWAKMDDATSFNFIDKVAASGAFGRGEYSFHTNGADKLYFWINDDSVDAGGGGAAVIARFNNSAITSDEGSWHHYVATYSGNRANSGLEIYRDGVAVSTHNGGNGSYTAMENTSNNLNIGKFQSDYSNGNIDEAAIWDVELSAANVVAIYNSGTPIALDADDGNYDKSGDLQCWWRMGDGTLDDGNIDGNGLIADQTNATLGSELFDSPASVFTSGTYAWAALGSNSISNDSNTLKISEGDNHEGAKLFFSDAADLSANLVVGTTYKLTFDAKISDATDPTHVRVVATVEPQVEITTTGFQSYSLYFVATATTTNYIRLNGLGDGEDLWIDNLSLKAVNGNSGIMTAMAASDIVTDTP